MLLATDRVGSHVRILCDGRMGGKHSYSAKLANCCAIKASLTCVLRICSRSEQARFRKFDVVAGNEQKMAMNDDM